MLLLSQPAPCLPHIINESLSLSSFYSWNKCQTNKTNDKSLNILIWELFYAWSILKCYFPAHNIRHTTLRENREAIAKLEQWNATESFHHLNCTHVEMSLDTCTELATLQGHWKMRKYLVSFRFPILDQFLFFFITCWTNDLSGPSGDLRPLLTWSLANWENDAVDAVDKVYKRGEER